MNFPSVSRSMSNRPWAGLALSAICLALIAAGCQSQPKRILLDALSMRDAVAIVNRNCDKIDGTLRAIGHVDGEFLTPEGNRRSYHLDGILFFLSPRFVRLDLKFLGSRKFLVGSNAHWYWYISDQDGQSHCAKHEQFESGASIIPISPTQIPELLGLSPISISHGSDRRAVAVQRVVKEYQQILMLETGPDRRWFDRKEVWLDRAEPRLVRRVIFRDANGEVDVESVLSQYRAVGASEVMLPHVMTAHWPKTGETMRFSVKQWRVFRELGPDAVQFAAPDFCNSPAP